MLRSRSSGRSRSAYRWTPRRPSKRPSPLPRELVGYGQLFMLRVKGDSICRGNAGRSPFGDARGIHRGHRGKIPQSLAAQPQCRAGMGQQVAGRERSERGSEPRNLIRWNYRGAYGRPY